MDLGRLRRRPRAGARRAADHPAEGPVAPDTPDAAHAACRAPFTSMYLDPRGEVRACCQNNWHRLGNVASTPLREIWRGAAAQELRRRVVEGHFDLGCDLCGECVERGDPDAAYLGAFSALSPHEPSPEWPTQLELALSNSCNLQCTMCSGDLSSSIRIHREQRAPLPAVYGERFFEELDDFLPHLEKLQLLGGEPFLGREPLRVLDRLVELDLRPVCSVTTNGTQWRPRLRRLVEQLGMHITVSVDGATAATVEAVRLGVDHADLVRNVREIQEAALGSGGSFTIAFCLMRATWHELGATLAWADELDADVFVNSVTHPVQMSLFHTDDNELQGIVASLEVEDGRRRQELGRNREVWERQLGALRHLLERRSSASDGLGTPVALGTRRPPTRDRTADRAAAPAIITVEPDQLVGAVDQRPPSAVPVDLAPLLGGSAHEVLVALSAAIEPVRRTRLVRRRDGGEQWFVEFGDLDDPRVLTTALTPGRDHRQHWEVAVERGSMDDVAPGERRS